MWHSKVHMLVFLCIHSMGLEGGGSSVFWVIHKSKDRKMQLNLANCAPTVTVISRTFSGISFCVNRVLCIGITQLSKFTINLLNNVRSTMDREVYASSHRRILSSSNCNWFCDLGSYDFLNLQTLEWSLLRQLVFSPFQLVFGLSLFDQLFRIFFSYPISLNANEIVS